MRLKPDDFAKFWLAVRPLAVRSTAIHAVPVKPCSSAISGLSKGRPKTETIKFLTQDEAGRLFHELGEHKRNKAMFLVAYRHGLRASEVGLLRTSDLDFKKLRIMLHRLKGSYSGEHPLQPDEAKAIKAYLRERDQESPILFTSSRGDPISRRTLDWLMKTYGAEDFEAADRLDCQWQGASAARGDAAETLLGGKSPRKPGTRRATKST